MKEHVTKIVGQFSAWEVIKKPTTTEEGEQTRICRICGEQERRLIEKLPRPVNPFPDVKPDDYFYKPVQWAVEKGITNSLHDGTVGSKKICNRRDVVTFLWRTMGKTPSLKINKPSGKVNTGI